MTIQLLLAKLSRFSQLIELFAHQFCTYLLFLANLVKQVRLSPLTVDPLLIIIGGEEADNTPRNHGTKVE